jgi:Histidine kinase-, DNA gyrase B-, and HSP90-like ATPase
VRMITKDISLEDCILDLIDNCLDGARKVKQSTTEESTVESYSGFEARVDLSEVNFQIVDNCGDIKIAEAIDYAFHFGRRPDAPAEADYSIGLYGIGMKRAIFKIGNLIDIYSSTASEAFRTVINVTQWLAKSSSDGKTEDWDFDMDDAAVDSKTGTTIRVTELYAPIAMQFGNPEFGNALARIVARDYAQFISKGFAIFINGKKIHGFEFTVRQSDEFKPIRTSYMDESGVQVEIIAGMSGAPPDELQASESRPDTDYFGWFVLCNDRVILAADKSTRTVWGDGDFPGWHYQYNGFVGMVLFNSKDPNLLPWRTTKRDVEGGSPVYRRAVERMKDATRPWVKYTYDRRGNLEDARRRELSAPNQPLFQVQVNPTLELPTVVVGPPGIAYSSIQYSKPTVDITKAKRLLGNQRMTNRRVGEMTFDYYLKNESEG